MKAYRRMVSMTAFVLVLLGVLVAFATPAWALDGVDIYRLYNPNSGEHFYTQNRTERDQLALVHGWNYEGVGWVAPSSGSPVYRLYNPNAGDHHYTMSVGERDMLSRIGWRYEGVGWMSDKPGTVPLMREYNPNARAGAHNFTTNNNEHKNLVGLGWRDEGIGWWATAAGNRIIVRKEAESMGYDSWTPADYNKKYGSDAKYLYTDDTTYQAAIPNTNFSILYTYRGPSYQGLYGFTGLIGPLGEMVQGLKSNLTPQQLAARLEAPRPFPKGVVTSAETKTSDGMLSFMTESYVSIRYYGLEDGVNIGDDGAGYGGELQIIPEADGTVGPNSTAFLWMVSG